MYISVTKKVDRKKIGYAKEGTVQVPVRCECGGFIIITDNKGLFQGAICADCGQSYQKLYVNPILGLMEIQSKVLLVGERCPWKDTK